MSQVVARSVPALAAQPIVEAGTGSGLPSVPEHVLSEVELLVLAASVASHPEQWRDQVAFREGDDGRHYVCLARNEFVDVWLLCWTPANDTGWHDHDVSSGAVAVVEGRLLEHNLAVGRPEMQTEIEHGRVFSFGPDHIHRLTGVDPTSVSVHAYSPPLQTMGQYVVDDNGVLHRTSVTYAEELRVLA